MDLSTTKINHDLAVSSASKAGSVSREEMASALSTVENTLEKFLGKPLPATPERAWVQFGNLNAQHQQMALAALRAQNAFVIGMMEEGITSTDEAAMLRFALSKLSLLSQEGLPYTVGPEHVVEIFDESHVQVYRSVNCFNLCNYSLLELSSYPWFELYERPPAFEQRYLEMGVKMAAGKLPYADVSDFPEYVIRETMTDGLEAFAIRDLFIANLRSTLNGRPYFLSVKKIRPLEENTNGLHFLRPRRPS